MTTLQGMASEPTSDNAIMASSASAIASSLSGVCALVVTESAPPPPPACVDDAPGAVYCGCSQMFDAVSKACVARGRRQVPSGRL